MAVARAVPGSNIPDLVRPDTPEPVSAHAVTAWRPPAPTSLDNEFDSVGRSVKRRVATATYKPHEPADNEAWTQVITRTDRQSRKKSLQLRRMPKQQPGMTIPEADILAKRSELLIKMITDRSELHEQRKGWFVVRERGKTYTTVNFQAVNQIMHCGPMG